MEHFRDGKHVCLRCRERGTYLHADDDGERLSLCSERASRNAAWRVQMFYEEGTMFFLQSPAYGRYLEATDSPAPPGLLTAQRDFTDMNPESFVWQPLGVQFGPGYAYLFIHLSRTVFRYLRANGSFIPCLTSVTVDDAINLNPMMYWVVEPIPPRASPPPLPSPMASADGTAEERWRKIRYVRPGADEVEFYYSGRSVLNLRSELARQLELDEAEQITMCVRAGRNARLTPLVVDLPDSEDRLDIVILMDGDPAIQELQHPNVDFTDDEH